ncbi:MAG TPA: acyl carrier protein [Acidimicrobiia bacterium]|nr:acyl carrier protein [Acidimicrobiia bacterium]
MSVSEQLKEHIAAEFMSGAPATQLEDQTRLIDEEIIDSLGIFLLVNFIQEKFGVDIDPEEVTIENFETVAAITELVSPKLPA